MVRRLACAAVLAAYVGVKAGPVSIPPDSAIPPFNTTYPFYTYYPDCENGPEALTTNLACNSSASPAARAAAIVAAMPISDKLQNLVDRANGSSTLGLPPYEWWSEALHGVAGSPGVNFSDSGEYMYATSFPEPITMASAYDDNMIAMVAEVVSTEARAFSNHHRAGLDFWTPNINPYRDPRWGRGMETPGEDPFHIQSYVKNLIANLETKNEAGIKRVIATAKHFAGYDLESWDGYLRYGYDARIPSQDLAEYYMPPFQQAARDSKVGSIMCSYNAVNGVPSCANSYLMQTILRDHWGWTEDNNYITSDCNAVDDMTTNHNYSSSLAEGSALAHIAGSDTTCVLDGQFGNVTGAYELGYLNESTIDQSLRRLYEGLVILGYFTSASENSYRSLDWSNVNLPSSQSLAREAAAKGLVMLKNNGILPYDFSNTKKVAMIGMWANGTTQMQGNYFGNAPYLHSPLFGAEELGLDYIYANGPLNESSITGNWTANITSAAEEADMIIYWGGIDISIEAEGQDRYEIGWSTSQLAAINQTCAMGKPCIVVQLGDQLDDTPLLNNPNVSAILWAGYPGQDGGPAVFDVITGKVAPAGRLSVTQYPANYVNEVPMTDMLLRPSSSNPGRTYMWYSDAVIPFGYGLHYTKFSTTFGGNGSDTVHASATYDISNLTSSCSEQYMDLCSFPSVPVSVENTGSVTSDYVALVFVNTTAGPGPYPLKKLVAYTRLSNVTAGSSQQATLSLNLGSLARRDETGNLVLYPGDYELLVDVPTQDTMKFTLTGSQVTLDEWPQPPADQTYNSTVQNCPLEGACKGQPVSPP